MFADRTAINKCSWNHQTITFSDLYLKGLINVHKVTKKGAYQRITKYTDCMCSGPVE